MKIVTLLKVVLQAVLFVVLLAIIFTVITSRSSLYGIRSYTVESGSMKPALQVGSVIYVRSQPHYVVGDIITFKRNGIDVSHRIVAIKHGQFQTKGDANNSPDSDLVSPNSVFGKEIFQTPLLGRLTAFTRTLTGYILLIAVPTFLFVGFEIWTIKEEYKKEIEKKLLKKQEAV